MTTITPARRSTSSTLAPDLRTRLSRVAEYTEGAFARYLQSAARVLRSEGYRIIGRGAFGFACLSPDGSTVVKAYGADKGYRAFLEIIKEFPRNPYLPRIYEQLDFAAESGVVVMERLPRTILWASADPAYARATALYWKARRRYYDLAGVNDLQGAPRGRPSVRLPVRLKAVLDRCAEIVNAGKPAVWADLHMNNAMVRADGTLVLIDPIAG